MSTEADLQEAATELCYLSALPQVQHRSFEALLQYISSHVNRLLKDDFSGLVQLLYRMDISEEKLRYYLAHNKGEMAANIIAQLMIERQLQKIETRRRFKQDDTHIPDDEKW